LANPGTYSNANAMAYGNTDAGIKPVPEPNPLTISKPIPKPFGITKPEPWHFTDT
jgi:hypothetical protein